MPATGNGYDGEGAGFAKSAADDALTFVPLGAVLGATGKAVRLARVAKVAESGLSILRSAGAAVNRGDNFGKSLLVMEMTSECLATQTIKHYPESVTP
ncbi:MAG: hypothetical protein P8X74_22080 [Reinekea sp.]